MRVLIVWLIVAVATAGCEDARNVRITVHRVGGGCVALYVNDEGSAMAAIPCPVTATEATDAGAP